VQKDETIGAKWLKVAANRGNAVAQNRLARIYAAGRGFPKDEVEAARWNILAKAGGRGDPELDTAFTKLPPDQQKKARDSAAAFKPVKP
jgi:uncharacterized protein